MSPALSRVAAFVAGALLATLAIFAAINALTSAATTADDSAAVVQYDAP